MCFGEDLERWLLKDTDSELKTDNIQGDFKDCRRLYLRVQASLLVVRYFVSTFIMLALPQ